MERETIELSLPLSNATVVMYTFLTTGEIRSLRRSTLGKMTLDLNSEGKPQIKDFSGEIAMDLEEITLKFLIKSISTKDGVLTEAEAISTFVSGLPAQDGNTLYQKINEISTDSNMSAEVKKK